MPPFIIPFFIAHEGCPHRCVFCNQHRIAGAGRDRVTPEAIKTEIDLRLNQPRKSSRNGVQVAFYGGSFTALSRHRQKDLLEAVYPYLAQGKVQQVRVSTRPDSIDGETADFLTAYGVRTVELGAQSMSDAVLRKAERGHTSGQIEAAVQTLREAGIKTGVQLMIGLPGETTASLIRGTHRLIAARPDFVRLYPTLVVSGSVLAEWYLSGTFRPYSLQKAVAASAKLKCLFEAAGIQVVRVGLQAAPSLEANMLAGPYHPSFGELVLSRIFYRKVRSVLMSGKKGNREPERLHISSFDESIFRGKGGRNLKRLNDLGLLAGREVVFDRGQARNTVYLSWKTSGVAC